MNLKQEINSYLKTETLMAVATYGNSPWIANVYYVHDEDLNLYFLSKTFREHCKAIEEDPRAAVAIADSSQPIFEPQKGIQLSGTAEQVHNVERLNWMFKMWNKLVSQGKGETLTDPKAFLDAGISAVYKITPTRIKFFNTELWPEEQIKELNMDDGTLLSETALETDWSKKEEERAWKAMQ